MRLWRPRAGGDLVRDSGHASTLPATRAVLAGVPRYAGPMMEILLTATQALLGTLGGVALALSSIVMTRWLVRRVARLELLWWAGYLALAAWIYVGFALREGGDGWMHVELAGAAGYTALAWLGVRRPPFLALGWLLHAGWDVVVHSDAPEGLVPSWYRWACLGYDVAAALYLVRLSPRRGAST